MANEQHIQWLLEGVEAWNRRREENSDMSVDLSGADLSNAILSGADLTRADLSNAILSGTDLSSTDLSNADLNNAILNNADLSNADLGGSDLNNADVADTEFVGANFTNTNLTGTKLFQAQLYYEIDQIPQHQITFGAVESVNSLIERIAEIKGHYRTYSNAFDLYFRGEDQSGWELRPAIMRDHILRDNEHNLLLDFVSRWPEEFNKLTSGLAQLVTAQHHSLKTRFLDVSSNPLVALFHACEESDDSTKIPQDAILYVFVVPRQLVKSFNSDTVSVIANYARLPKYHQITLVGGDTYSPDYKQSMDQLHQLVQSEKPYFVSRIDPRDFYRVIFVEPQRSSDRIRAQSGAFMVSAFHERLEREEILKLNDRIPVYAYYRLTIRGVCRVAILQELKMLKISRETLFPGLDESAKSIMEYYNSPAVNYMTGA